MYTTRVGADAAIRTHTGCEEYTRLSRANGFGMASPNRAKKYKDNYNLQCSSVKTRHGEQGEL